MTRLLFVTWDGPQVSYLEGLFLPIFTGLRKHGYEFGVLQFTWGDAQLSQRVADTCRRQNVPYRRIEVLRLGAIGALLTAASGGRHVDRAVRDWNIDALLPRSLLPALASMISRSVRTCPMIFDSDGLPADERVEFAALNPRGLTYGLLRLIEAHAIRRAQVVLVRTKAAIAVLAKRAGRNQSQSKFHVVTNGRDPQPFLAATVDDSIVDRPRLCCLGSVGPQYLPEQMLALASELKRRFPRATLTLFTSDSVAMTALLRSQAMLDQDWISVRTLAPSEVPQVISNYDVGFALRQPSLSMSAVAPVKIGDYLLAGLPIIGTPGVGTTEDAFRAGCMIAADAGPEAIAQWLSSVLADRTAWRSRCREIGIKCFSLQRTVKDYREALQVLQSSESA